MTTPLAGTGLSHAYRGAEVAALAGVSIELVQGVTALVGVNGAGKSTLLRTLAGAQRPDSGAVRLGELDPYRRGERAQALRSIGLMPQLTRFPPSMTVTEVVTSLGWLKGMRWARARARAAAVVDAVGLGDRAKRKVGTLSGGMARRLALAQALVHEPDVVLLDEPSTGLDPEQRRAMIELVGSLEATVLFSSHVMEDVEDVAERVVVLDGGRVLFTGPLTDLRDRGAAARGTSGRGSLAENGFLDLLRDRRPPA